MDPWSGGEGCGGVRGMNLVQTTLFMGRSPHPVHSCKVPQSLSTDHLKGLDGLWLCRALAPLAYLHGGRL